MQSRPLRWLVLHAGQDEIHMYDLPYHITMSVRYSTAYVGPFHEGKTRP